MHASLATANFAANAINWRGDFAFAINGFADNGNGFDMIGAGFGFNIAGTENNENIDNEFSRALFAEDCLG